ncbi:MAG TPA: 2-amino-4-hydroxy-6-hydroxymethyldihydropteridine diphosphokinase [Nannocystis exedens]|nr:2-amino-4-hydroxy-6-hydroxymethyldihydropteridine diphosphokinase [Nannocystis exedens]
MRSARAYVGLGSNLGDRLITLQSAARHLQRALPGVVLSAWSTIYESRPIGPAHHAFLNAAVELRGSIEPEALLQALHRIEALHGRRRQFRWGARTLDLDLLVVLRAGKSLRRASEFLTLPHPGLQQRDFVLAPLAELNPGLRPDGRHRVDKLLETLPTVARTIFERRQEPLC